MSIPEPEVVLESVAHLLPTVYSALQHGTFKAQEFFGQQEDGLNEIEPYLASTLVRYNAKKVLRKSGQLIINSDDLKIEKVANNGLCISYGDYVIRILKTSNDELPVPGHSKSRRLFYCQYHKQYDLALGLTEQKAPTNLVILWDVSPSYELSRLSLACPKSGGHTRDSVSVHWHFPIPNNILLGQPATNVQIVYMDSEDLPLTLKTDIEIDAEDRIG